MTQTLPGARREAAQLPSRAPDDRRRHKRISVTLLGRFMRGDKSEHACRLLDVSAGGAALISPVAVEVGEKIVAYLDHLGGIEGTVARIFDGGFAVRIAATSHKRKKLVAQLTWLANRHEIIDTDGRRHERLAPRSPTSTLTLAEGIVVPCQILDFSISGASIGTPARPPIGHEVQVGRKLRAKVVRHHPNGIGVQFLDIQTAAALTHYFE